jgi:sec-independent protein translocase protein TatB
MRERGITVKRSRRRGPCVAALALPHYDEAMSFSDTVFLFFLALILFGPKKLPEMARQAGRLLAELRRASNEFKSQIETEIAHLEVEKHIAIPASPPLGTVASLSVNPAMGESIPHEAESAATLAAPTVETPAASSSPTSAPDATPATEAVVDPNASTSQASHV